MVCVCMVELILTAVCAVRAAIVGRLGLVPLGAVGLSNLVHFFATVFFSFLLVVTTPRVADALAVSDTPKARQGSFAPLACLPCMCIFFKTMLLL